MGRRCAWKWKQHHKMPYSESEGKAVYSPARCCFYNPVWAGSWILLWTKIWINSYITAVWENWIVVFLPVFREIFPYCHKIILYAPFSILVLSLLAFFYTVSTVALHLVYLSIFYNFPHWQAVRGKRNCVMRIPGKGKTWMVYQG